MFVDHSDRIRRSSAVLPLQFQQNNAMHEVETTHSQVTNSTIRYTVRYLLLSLSQAPTITMKATLSRFATLMSLVMAIAILDATAFCPSKVSVRGPFSLSPRAPGPKSEPRSTWQPSLRNVQLFSEPKKKSTSEILGIDRGLYLIAIVLLFNVWIFSIPPEFRRAKICSEEQVIQFPESGCMTGAKWASGIKDYYANGGGISFDFSIDPKSQPKWMGGEQPFQK